MRIKLALLLLLPVLGYLNLGILSKESLKANGETILLELAPRDPRSLLQAPVMTRPERNPPFGCHSQGFKQTIAIGQSAVTGIEHHTFLNSRVPLVPPKPKELDRA